MWGKQGMQSLLHFTQISIRHLLTPRQMETICRVNGMVNNVTRAEGFSTFCIGINRNAGISFLRMVVRRGNVLIPSGWKGCAFPLNN